MHHHTYACDNLGNLTQRIDQTQSVTENFAYDSLNRLTMVSGTVATRSFAYDALGNMTAKSDVGTYTYPTPGAGAVRPHAVTSVTGAVNATYTYDANGNLISGNGRALTYTSFNAPATIANASYGYAYTYNAEHERVRLVTTRPDDTLTSLYFHPDGKGKLFYEREERQSDGRLEHKHYIQAGAELVGVYVTRSDSFTEMRYYHHDHLGSVALITNEAGAPIERLAYEAFGERRYPNGNPQDRMSPLIGITTDRGFTSHEHLDELNLIHMNGRVYDPVLGRFMTADPFIQSPGNLQSYNRYSYVFNNPLAYTDPSGYFSLGKAFKKLFAAAFAPILDRQVFRVAVSIAAAYYFGPYLNLGGNAIANGAIGGFAGNFVASGGNFEAGLQGALSGGLFGWAGGVNVQNPFSFERLAAHALAGCLSATAGGGKCAQGAASAVVGKVITHFTLDKNMDNITRGVVVSIAGGISAQIAGGKFANGAFTAAYGYLFNYCSTLSGGCLRKWGENLLRLGGGLASMGAGIPLCAGVLTCAAGGPMTVFGASETGEAINWFIRGDEETRGFNLLREGLRSASSDLVGAPGYGEALYYGGAFLTTSYSAIVGVAVPKWSPLLKDYLWTTVPRWSTLDSVQRGAAFGSAGASAYRGTSAVLEPQR